MIMVSLSRAGEISLTNADRSEPTSESDEPFFDPCLRAPPVLED